MTTTCARSGKLVCTTFSGLTIVVAMPVDKAIDELIDVVPELRGERVVTELAGGLTNTNYKVETDQGAFVVRISAKDSGMLAIDRENEYLNTVAAAEEGVGPSVIGYIPERSLMVLEYIDGQTQSAEDLRRDLEWLPVIGLLCHACITIAEPRYASGLYQQLASHPARAVRVGPLGA